MTPLHILLGVSAVLVVLGVLGYIIEAICTLQQAEDEAATETD